MWMAKALKLSLVLDAHACFNDSYGFFMALYLQCVVEGQMSLIYTSCTYDFYFLCDYLTNDWCRLVPEWKIFTRCMCKNKSINLRKIACRHTSNRVESSRLLFVHCQPLSLRQKFWNFTLSEGGRWCSINRCRWSLRYESLGMVDLEHEICIFSALSLAWMLSKRRKKKLSIFALNKIEVQSLRKITGSCARLCNRIAFGV